MLAVLVYLGAIALPIYCLHHFRSQSWIFHLFATAAAVGIGFVPIPPDMQRRGYDLLIGFAFVFLLVWGVGGLIVPHRHHEKHA